MKTLKCAWCGALVGLTKNGARPAQHKNGKTTCVGSGQLAATHERLRATRTTQPADGAAVEH